MARAWRLVALLAVVAHRAIVSGEETPLASLGMTITSPDGQQTSVTCDLIEGTDTAQSAVAFVAENNLGSNAQQLLDLVCLGHPPIGLPARPPARKICNRP